MLAREGKSSRALGDSCIYLLNVLRRPNSDQVGVTGLVDAVCSMWGDRAVLWFASAYLSLARTYAEYQGDLTIEQVLSEWRTSEELNRRDPVSRGPTPR